ncbi:MAG: hypothetical protein KF817_08120 [Phycisphaeraceae bacterium]|nr:hypothetical protein [Phycisphaeraceae bacterium]
MNQIMHHSIVAIGALMALTGPTFADGRSDARRLYESIHASRVSLADAHGSITILRRLESAPQATPADVAAQKAAVLAANERIQGRAIASRNAAAVGEMLDAALRTDVRTVLEEIHFDGDVYRIESWDIGAHEPADLSQVRPEEVRRRVRPDVAGFDGEKAILIPASEENAVVILSDMKYRLPPVAELGRAPARMPSLAELDALAGADPLPIDMEIRMEFTGPIYILTIGHPESDGLVIRLAVDAYRDLALVFAEVRFGRQVLSSDQYSDFITMPNGRWYPRRSVRENYDMDLATGERSLRSREEFLVVGVPAIGRVPTADDLVVHHPEGARIERMFESIPAPSAQAR